jgi:hypothetical protein
MDSRLTQNAGLIYLGKISYGLYVYHLPGFWIAERLFGNPHGHLQGAVLFVASFCFTVALAAASYGFLEPPFLRAKKGLYVWSITTCLAKGSRTCFRIVIRSLRDEFVIQFKEARAEWRRRHPKNSGGEANARSSDDPKYAGNGLLTLLVAFPILDGESLALHNRSPDRSRLAGRRTRAAGSRP